MNILHRDGGSGTNRLTRRRNGKTRRKSFVAAGMALLLMGGVAGAVFLSQATPTHGTSHVTTQSGGATVPVTITDDGVESTSGGPATALSPGGSTELAVFKLTTTGSAVADVSTISFSIPSDGNGNVLDTANGNAPVPGCLASYFQLSSGNTDFLAAGLGQPPTGPANVPFSVNSAGVLVGEGVTMPANAADQSACEGISPEIQLSVNGG
jgi:hypothetical protein